MVARMEDDPDVEELFIQTRREELHHLADDLAHAHYLLDCAGAPEGVGLTGRILAIAERWLVSAHHQDGCQCRQCLASRKLIAAAKSLEL